MDEEFRTLRLSGTKMLNAIHQTRKTRIAYVNVQF